MGAKIDWRIIGSYLLLSGLGLLMLSSLSPDRLAQQALIVFLGIIFMFGIGQQDIRVILEFGPFAYLTSLFLLLATLIFGTPIRGSTRWLDIGSFPLQTSEILKPLFILSLAYFLRRFPPTSFKNILLHLVLLAIPGYLVFRQPDLGSSLVLGAIWSGMVFVAGIPFFVVGIGLVVMSTMGYLAPYFLKPYQLERLVTFLDPYHDPLGSGYNVIQAIIAIGSGQFFGLGLGRGTQSHFRYLPERHTDFMFASLSEELGFIGSFAVIAIFIFLFWHLLSLIRSMTDMGARLVLVGVFFNLFFQCFINIGMNLGIAPVTGITLPLISYGGSSALATALTLGLAISASRSREPKSFLEIT